MSTTSWYLTLMISHIVLTHGIIKTGFTQLSNKILDFTVINPDKCFYLVQSDYKPS